MEICSRRGMGRDGSGYISNKVRFENALSILESIRLGSCFLDSALRLRDDHPDTRTFDESPRRALGKSRSRKDAKASRLWSRYAKQLPRTETRSGIFFARWWLPGTRILSILECRARTPWDIGSRPIHGLTLQKAADALWAPIFCGLTNPAVARTLRTRRSWLLRLRVVEELVARWLNIVSTNDPALRLWQKLGFKIVGTLPGAFRHPEKGYVDVYVMFRSLL